MREFLRKIKLIDFLTIQLSVDKSTFIDNLKDAVDEGDTSIFSGLSDLFDRSKNYYRGSVNYEGFKIRRKRKMFDPSINIALITGKYRKAKDDLIIDVEINGFSRAMIPFYIMITLLYIIFFTMMISMPEEDSEFTWITIPFLIFHAAFMFAIPYMIARRSVKRLKYDLEREFYFLSQKDCSRNS